ncbi:MAG: hypothetical protein AAGL49_07330, partial [Pseudomonadota bacterium]
MFLVWRAVKENKLLAASGTGLALALALIALLSSRFQDGAGGTFGEALPFVGLLMGAGAAYLVLLKAIPSSAGRSTLLLTCLLIGAAFRLIFFGSTPIYEDDWRRYLWDGAVSAAGISPYSYAPADAALADPLGRPLGAAENPDIETLQRLGAADDRWPELINYPYLTTIYPPLAQLAFYAAHTIAPFNLDAWRLVLLVADVATLVLLLKLLAAWGRDPLW